MIFCTDVDLLHWEPNLLGDVAFGSQLLLSGTGTLAGTSFTLAAGSLAAAHIEPDQVITLSGAISGCYPIVSVASDTELTVSVLYDGLFPAEGEGVASPIGSAADVTFAIRTFWPQRKIVSDLLTLAAGIGPQTSAPATATIINPLSLRRACTLGTLQLIYNALAAAADSPSALSVRAELYERLYRRSLEQARVEIDLDGDGRPEVARTLNVLELKRE